MTLNRRQVLRASAATLPLASLAGGFHAVAGEPRRDKFRVAGVGIGGRGNADLREMASHADFQLTAACDVDTRFFENGKKFNPEVACFQDYRQMMDQAADQFDAVVVATPDHMHAPITLLALEHGKHVYLQKPLCQDIGECRQLAEAAAAHPKLVTQMGIQIHSHAAYRTAVRWIQQGLIGTVSEVHSWSGKGWGGELPVKEASPIPDYLNWDLYCGVSEKVDFVEGYYHRGNWRKWLAFGTGPQGDMGCHIVDPVFSALQLKQPTEVTSLGPPPFERNFPLISHVQYKFRGTDYTTPELDLTWYNGSLRPEKLNNLPEGIGLPGQGSVFIGEKGSLILPHIGDPQVFGVDGKPVEKLPETVGHANHFHDWIDACQTDPAKATAQFDYSGPLTEAVLMGTVINRWPEKTFAWNAEKCRFDGQGPEVDQANALLLPEYRSGW